jgi:hypothetical protein
MFVGTNKNNKKSDPSSNNNINMANLDLKKSTSSSPFIKPKGKK